MNYIKAKYPNSNRTYTYRTEDSVSAGDTVVTDRGVKLTVAGEADMAWVETYGADKVAVVKKYEEPTEPFDRAKATEAQENYCKEKGYPHFAPNDGRCWKCNQNIYDNEGKSRNGRIRNGISVERAGRQLITGCPFCNWSYCE